MLHAGPIYDVGMMWKSYFPNVGITLVLFLTFITIIFIIYALNGFEKLGEKYNFLNTILFYYVGLMMVNGAIVQSWISVQQLIIIVGSIICFKYLNKDFLPFIDNLFVRFFVILVIMLLISGALYLDNFGQKM